MPSVMTLDTFEELRNECNAQKMFTQGRFAFVNTALASALHQDDRTRSKLYYGELQDGEGLRKWNNLCGVNWVREYPDFPAAGANLCGLAGDPRLAAVSVRKLQDMSELPKALGIPRVMEFYPLRDEETKLELCGIAWQEQGTGDAFLSVAILFGVGVGNQNGGVGTKTDYAGCLIRTS